MTSISIDEEGVDVVYEGTDFRMDRELIEEATGKTYTEVTDHEVLQLIEDNPTFTREPRRIGDVL